VPTESSTVQSPFSEISEIVMDPDDATDDAAAPDAADDDDADDDAADDDDAKTEVTSNTAPSNLQRMPQLQSLQRECEALKQIIRSDSSKMFELRADLETLRGQVSQHLAQIRLLKSELDAVKRQRDAQRERESQHKESIKVLKAEIDQLTQAGWNVVSRQEMEQMRIEHELLAAQIIETEYELSQMQSFVEVTDAENRRLRSLGLVQPNELRNETAVRPKKEPSHGDLTEIVLALEARLSAVEHERERSKEDFEEVLRQRTKEMASLEDEILEDPTPEEQPWKLEMSMSHDEEHSCTETLTDQNYTPAVADGGAENHGEEIECTLNGPIVGGQSKPPNDSNERATNTGGTCDAWSGLCDCFSPASSEEP
jgi:chromosome segregation ATPase